MIGNAIDLLPNTIAKPEHIDTCQTLVELLSSQTYLLYNHHILKNTHGISTEMEAQRQFYKSPQYHVNEIMQNGISSDF